MRTITKFYKGILLCLAIVIGTGCASYHGTPDKNKLESIALTVEYASYLGVSRVITKNPDTEVYFATVAEALSLALVQETLEPTALLDLIDSYLVKKGFEDFSGVVMLGLDVAYTNYAAFYRVNVEDELNTRPALKRLIMAVQSGLQRATSKSVSTSETSIRLEDCFLSDKELKL